MTEKDLLDQKEELNELKGQLNELKGQQKLYSKQLKDEYECNTLEEAQERLTGLKTDLEKLDKTIEEKTDNLIENYFND